MLEVVLRKEQDTFRVEIREGDSVLDVYGEYRLVGNGFRFWPYGHTYGDFPRGLLDGKPMDYSSLSEDARRVIYKWFAKVAVASDLDLYTLFPSFRGGLNV